MESQNRDQRNILAYFKSPQEAEKVEEQLKQLGVRDTSVDRISAYPGSGVDHVMNPITGDFPSLGYLTLDADYSNISAGILSAVDVNASGMSDGGDETISGRDILLTAVVDEVYYNQAMSLIKTGGGMV
ncbi:MAG: hypothetical protein K0R75_61 [Paenibacillaceae bacterium]|jgi:hypothetical protein|nr:hypothetical protein [Paenibacillaceae bacterium]